MDNLLDLSAKKHNYYSKVQKTTIKGESKIKMKKILLTFCLVFSVLLSAYSPSMNSFAGGAPASPARINASAASVQVGSSITFTVHSYNHKCVNDSDPTSYYLNTSPTCGAGYSYQGEVPAPGSNITASVSGSGNTLSPASGVANSNGDVQFTLSSTVAEQKTITASEQGTVVATKTISFTNPAPPPAPAAPKPATTTAAPAPKQAEVAPPASPTLEIKIDNTLIKADEKPIVHQDKPLVLSGKTVPNGIVNIYVFSEPKKYTTTADKDGIWSFQVPVSELPAGEHHAEAEVTDPATGKTSQRAQVLAFSVQDTPVAEATNNTGPSKLAEEASSKTPLIAAGAALTLLLLAYGYFWIFKRSILPRFLGGTKI